jgi:hypothetical protein
MRRFSAPRRPVVGIARGPQDFADVPRARRPIIEFRDMTRPHIFVATPCYGGQLSLAYVTSVLKLQSEAAAQRGSMSRST